MTQTIRKVIFPVGGLGTRMLPATKVLPKELLPVIDKPLIQYAIDEALASGAEHLIFVTGGRDTMLEAYLKENKSLEKNLRAKGKARELELLRSILPEGVKTSFVPQSEPLGLGHAVWCGRQFIDDDEPFGVILPDDLVVGEVPCLEQMADAYEPSMDAMIGIVQIADAQIEKYGVLETSRQSGLCVFATGMVEKPSFSNAPSQFAAIGRYILRPSVMKALDNPTKGMGGEIQLTDAIASVIRGEGLCGYLFEGDRYDCGSKEGFIQAILAVASRHEELKGLLPRLTAPYQAA